MGRRTKIVCTIGPASAAPARLSALIEAGMDVARLNFSHGTHEEHAEVFHSVRRLAAEHDRSVAILMDLQGPKIRVGSIVGGMVELHDGEPLTITTEEVEGDASLLSTSYRQLPEDVRPGDRILLADGILELQVEETDTTWVRCRVTRGGLLSSHKGINLPGVRIASPSLTAKDREDLALALELGADFVALSFVRSADDVAKLKELVRAADAPTRVVAKIERPEAVEHFNDILDVTDAVMIARGDLAVETGFDTAPLLQKRLIRECNLVGAPVITATQMLESMVDHVRPTRAEAADVANAIFDGTDAVMLSGETAVGKYPMEACRVMARIAQKTDEGIAPEVRRERRAQLKLERERILRRRRNQRNAPLDSFADTIGLAASAIEENLPLRRIVCFTNTGYTAAAVARYRPALPITSLTTSEETRRRCAMIWGVESFVTEDCRNLDELAERVDTLLLKHGLAEQGDTVLIAGGSPICAGGRTNMLQLHEVGRT